MSKREAGTSLTLFRRCANIAALKRVIVIFLLFVLVVAGVLLFFTLHKPTPPAATLLPDTTLVFLETPDFPRLQTACRSTAAQALWNEPAIQASLAEPLRALNTAFGRPASDPGSLLDQLLPGLQGEAFVALTHFAGPASLQSGLVLGADLKHKLIETKAVLFYKEANLKIWVPTAQITTKRHLGIKYTVVELNPQLQICHTFFGSLLVITFNEDILRDIIARSTSLTQADSPSLAQNPAYQATRQQLPPGHHLMAFFNTGQVLGPLMAVARQRSGPLAGFARIDATACSMTITTGAVHDTGVTVYTKAAPTPPHPVRQKTRAFTSPQTSCYLAGSTDFVALHQSVLDIAAQLNQAAWNNGVARCEQALTALGIRLTTDVLPALGPETALVAIWRDGARFPDVALVTECRNTPDFQNKLDVTLAVLKDTALGSDADFPWDNTDHLGVRLRTAHIGSSVLAPTYFFADNFFVLTLNPDYARELLTQLRTGTTTLAGNLDYARLAARLPTNGTAYTYCDLRAVFPPLYALWRANLTNTVVSVDQLPPADVITRHLGPYISASQTTPTNDVTVTYSALGKPLTLLLAGAGTFLWAQPWLAEHVKLVNLAPPKPSSNTAAAPPPPGNPTTTGH